MARKTSKPRPAAPPVVDDVDFGDALSPPATPLAGLLAWRSGRRSES